MRTSFRNTRRCWWGFVRTIWEAFVDSHTGVSIDQNIVAPRWTLSTVGSLAMTMMAGASMQVGRSACRRWIAVSPSHA